MTDPERFQCQINSTWPNEGIMSSSHDFPLQRYDTSGPRPYTAFFWKESKHRKGGKGEPHMGRNSVLPSLHVITTP